MLMNCSLNFDASLLHKKRALDSSIFDTLGLCWSFVMQHLLLAIERMNYDLFGGVKWHVRSAVVAVLVMCHKNPVRCLSLLFYTDDEARMMSQKNSQADAC